jgi:hypothetical protein
MIEAGSWIPVVLHALYQGLLLPPGAVKPPPPSRSRLPQRSAAGSNPSAASVSATCNPPRRCQETSIHPLRGAPSHLHRVPDHQGRSMRLRAGRRASGAPPPPSRARIASTPAEAHSPGNPRAFARGRRRPPSAGPAALRAPGRGRRGPLQPGSGARRSIHPPCSRTKTIEPGARAAKRGDSGGGAAALRRAPNRGRRCRGYAESRLWGRSKAGPLLQSGIRGTR